MQIISGESEVYVDTLSAEHALSGQPLLECAPLYNIILKVSFRLPSNRQHNAVITPNIEYEIMVFVLECGLSKAPRLLAFE